VESTTYNFFNPYAVIGFAVPNVTLATNGSSVTLFPEVEYRVGCTFRGIKFSTGSYGPWMISFLII